MDKLSKLSIEDYVIILCETTIFSNMVFTSHLLPSMLQKYFQSNSYSKNCTFKKCLNFWLGDYSDSESDAGEWTMIPDRSLSESWWLWCQPSVVGQTGTAQVYWF